MKFENNQIKLYTDTPTYVIVRKAPSGEYILCSGYYKYKENAIKELEKRKNFRKENPSLIPVQEGWGELELFEFNLTYNKVK